MQMARYFLSVDIIKLYHTRLGGCLIMIWWKQTFKEEPLNQKFAQRGILLKLRVLYATYNFNFLCVN